MHFHPCQNYFLVNVLNELVKLLHRHLFVGLRHDNRMARWSGWELRCFVGLIFSVSNALVPQLSQLHQSMTKTHFIPQIAVSSHVGCPHWLIIVNFPQWLLLILSTDFLRLLVLIIVIFRFVNYRFLYILLLFTYLFPLPINFLKLFLNLLSCLKFSNLFLHFTV